MPPLFIIKTGRFVLPLGPLRHLFVLSGARQAEPSQPVQVAVTGIPDSALAVRMVSDVFTLATLGAGVRCVVRIC